MGIPLINTPTITLVMPLYYCGEELYLPIERSIRSTKLYQDDWMLRDKIKLVVIDDASPLEIPPHWPVSITNEENLGFTATVNKGLSESQSDITVVMNDDIEITQELIERFLHLDFTKPIIASPADTSSSDDDRFGSCWGITRAAYELLAPLSEEYRDFYSDVDYYIRAKKAGVEVIKWHDIILSHPESSTYKLVNKEKLLAEDKARFDKRIVR